MGFDFKITDNRIYAVTAVIKEELPEGFCSMTKRKTMVQRISLMELILFLIII